MLYQWVEALVLGQNYKGSPLVFCLELSHIEGDVKIKGIAALPLYFYPFNAMTKSLRLLHQLKRNTFLRLTDKYPYKYIVWNVR